MIKIRSALFASVDKLSRSQKRTLLLLIEMVLAPVALLVSTAVAYDFMPTSGMLLRLLPFVVATSLATGLYSVLLKIPHIKLKAYDSHAIIRTGVLSLLAAATFGAMIRLFGVFFPQPGIVLFGLLFFLLAVATRVGLLHGLLWVLSAGRARQRVVIYGAGDTGQQLAAALREHEGIVPVAFVDDNPGLHSSIIAGLRIHPAERIAQIATDLGAERVVLAMPSVAAPKLAQIARRLEALGLMVMSVPSFAQLVGVEKLVDRLQVVPAQFLGRRPFESELPQGGEAYQGRTVLVSGAGGSVGSELCRQLLHSRPKRLVLFDVSEIALYTIDRELSALACGSGTEVVPVLGSVTDARMARMVMEDYAVDVVFHAAAYKHVPLVEANPIAGLANNVLGTRTLGDAANDAGVRSFILISTDKAVRPTNIMGASKRLAELVVQDLAKRSKGTVFSMVRFGNVLGSSGSVIPLFRDQIARGGPVTLTHEDVTRYFMTIAEASQLVLLAGSYAAPGGSAGGDVFVLDMGKPVRIRDLAHQMIEAAGYSVRNEANPEGEVEIVVTGLRPGEKLHEELLIGEGQLTTPHPRILRAQEHSLSELEMAGALRALRSAVATGDAVAARRVVHACVEGYQAPEPIAVAP